jgi:hypothetical protein
LKGRADLVERKDGVTSIYDIKSGRVIDSSGNLVSTIIRQMHLYGLMAAEIWPDVALELFVSSRHEIRVEFTSQQTNDIRQWLALMLRDLPNGASVSANSLAMVGRACAGCPFRHVCSEYLSRAPEQWTGATDERLPLDTWGEVTSMKDSSAATANLILRDAAGRVVKVFGVSRYRLDGVQPGAKVWFFGLRNSGQPGGQAEATHPRNFFEIGEASAYDRAWALAVYSESNSASAAVE